MQHGRGDENVGVANIKSSYMEGSLHANMTDTAIKIDMECDTNAEETATSSAKKLAELKKESANQIYITKKYQEAIQLYTEAIELCPDSSVYYGNRSCCYIMMYQYRAALADARKAVALDSSFAKGHIRIARCSLALGDMTAVNSALSAVRELSLNNSAILPQLQKLEAIIRYDREGTIACQKQDYLKALVCTDQILEQIPCTRYKLKRAGCLILLRRYQEAKDIANDILHVDKQNADAVYVRGLCFYYQDNMEKAFHHFKHALRLAPNHQRAMVIYKRAKALMHGREEGNKAYAAGRFEEAYALYTEALEADPNNKSVNAKIFVDRATVCSKLGRFNEAVTDCSNALRFDGNDRNALLLRAKCYRDLRDFAKAVRDYEKIYKMDRSQHIKKLLEDAKLALKNTEDKDYYKICGVNTNAPLNEIKKAYKRKALVHHPDRHIGMSDDARKKHEEAFKEVHEAYLTLSDVRKRARYDMSLYDYKCVREL
jgi:DnaJ family protein C protein 7